MKIEFGMETKWYYTHLSDSFLLGLSKHYKKQVTRMFHAQCPPRYMHKIQIGGQGELGTSAAYYNLN